MVKNILFKKLSTNTKIRKTSIIVSIMALVLSMVLLFFFVDVIPPKTSEQKLELNMLDAELTLRRYLKQDITISKAVELTKYEMQSDIINPFNPEKPALGKEPGPGVLVLTVLDHNDVQISAFGEDVQQVMTKIVSRTE